MSLVNEVIEEIRHREGIGERLGVSPPPAREASRFGPAVVAPARGGGAPLVPWLLAAAGFAVLLVQAVSNWSVVVTPAPASEPPAVSARPPGEAYPSRSTIKTEFVERPKAVEYAELTDIDVQLEDGYTRTFFRMSSERDYWLHGDPSHGEIEIVISRTRLTTVFGPYAFEGSGMTLREAHNSSEGLHLLMSFEPASRVQAQVVYDDFGPVLVLDLIEGRDREAASSPAPAALNGLAVPATEYDVAMEFEAAVAVNVEPQVEIDADESESGKSWGVISHRTSSSEAEAGDAFPSYQRGLDYAVRGQTDDAIAEYLRALAVDPNLHSAREELVILLIETERFDAATRHLEEAMSRAPSHEEYNFLKAQLLVATQQPDRAVAILESQPVPPERRGDAVNLLAALYQQRGDHGKAETLFRHAVQLAPHEARLWMGLGISLEGQQRGVEALSVYKQADSLATFDTGPRRWLRSRIRELSSLE